MELATKHNLTIIEDCAQAHGATYKEYAENRVNKLAGRRRMREAQPHRICAHERLGAD